MMTVSLHQTSFMVHHIIIFDLLIDLQLQLGSEDNIQEVMEGERTEICAKLMLNRQTNRSFSVNISTITETGDTASTQ